MSKLEIARGVHDPVGATFWWMTEPADRPVLTFPTMDEALDCIYGHYDEFVVTFSQHPQQRTFTVWQMPWTDAAGPEGEPWIT